MLTLNKLNNLLSYWIIFENDNHVISDFSIDYIVEKYNIIFNKKIINSFNLFEFFSNNCEIQKILFDYCKKWRLNFEDLINNDNFGILVFTIYLRSNNGYFPTPLELRDKYMLFFGNYDYISNSDKSHILHAVLRIAVDDYKKIHHKVYRDIELKTKINRLLNNK